MTGSNFIVGILLARWLAPDQYGAYAIAYAFFLLLSLVFQALILEPMSVFGPSTYRESMPEYFGMLVRLYLGFSALLLILLLVSTVVEWKVLHAGTLAAALVGIAIATPCILLLWLARNAFYARLSPQGSALGGVTYSILLLGGIAVLHRAGHASPLTVFLLMAGAGLATATMQFARLKPVYKQISGITLGNVFRRHWRYGKWVLASSFVVWIPSNIYYVLFSGNSHMLAAAELRALLNLTLPVGQTATALSLLLQPYMAREQTYWGTAATISLVRKATFLYAAGATAYWLVVLPFSNQALHLLYGDKYAALNRLIPWVGLSSILAVAAHGPGAGLRAIQSPSLVFTAFCAASGVTVVIGIPAALAFGLPGTVATLVAANALAMFLVARLFYQRARSVPHLERLANEQPVALAMEQ